MTRLKKRSLSIESFDYRNKNITYELQDTLRGTVFLGVSGEVKFTEKGMSSNSATRVNVLLLGDRIALTQIEQMVGGKYIFLASFNTSDDSLKWEKSPVWFETGKPPRDRTIIVTQLKTVSQSFYWTLNAISAIGILWTIGLICFNFKFRKFRLVLIKP